MDWRGLNEWGISWRGFDGRGLAKGPGFDGPASDGRGFDKRALNERRLEASGPGWRSLVGQTGFRQAMILPGGSKHLELRPEQGNILHRSHNQPMPFVSSRSHNPRCFVVPQALQRGSRLNIWRVSKQEFNEV